MLQQCVWDKLSVRFQKIYLRYNIFVGQDSSDDIVTRLRTGSQKNRAMIARRRERFFWFPKRPCQLRFPASLLFSGWQDLFLRGGSECGVKKKYLCSAEGVIENSP